MELILFMKIYFFLNKLQRPFQVEPWQEHARHGELPRSERSTARKNNKRR